MNIIFHSTISKVDGKYFMKDVFATYLVNLSKNAEVNFITPVLSERQHFHTQEVDIDATRLTIKSVPSNYFKKIFFFFKCMKADGLSLIFMPTYSGALASFISIILKKKYILYLGTDWSTIREKRSVLKYGKVTYINRLLSFFDKMNNAFVSRNAELILVTGGQLKEIYSNFNLNVVETKPIINIKSSKDLFDINTSKGEYNVLFVGKVTRAKGVFDIIECVKLISKEVNITFTIVGDGDAVIELDSIIKESDLSYRVKLKGYVKNGPELFKEYLNADAFLLPSYFEGFPRVLYEAMQFNLPIITTPVNSIPYLLEDNKTALFIEVGNPISIKDALLKIYQNKEISDTLVKNGRELIESVLNEPAWAQHLKILKNS